MSMRAEDWQASEESCSIILVKARSLWYPWSRLESWHNRCLCKKIKKVKKMQKPLYTLRYKHHLTLFGFLLLTSVPLCNSNLSSRTGSTYSDSHQTCSEWWVKCKQQWAILCALQRTGLAPSSRPGPDLPGQTETELGVLTRR